MTRLYHEPLIDKHHCTQLLPATYIISKKVTEMFTPWKKTWKEKRAASIEEKNTAGKWINYLEDESA